MEVLLDLHTVLSMDPSLDHQLSSPRDNSSLNHNHRVKSKLKTTAVRAGVVPSEEMERGVMCTSLEQTSGENTSLAKRLDGDRGIQSKELWVV